MPYAPLESYVRRMLLRPGKAEEMDHWRHDSDWESEDPHTPILKEEWLADVNPNEVLRDIHDGYAWRSIEGDIRRIFDPQHRVVYDRGISETPVRFVSKRLGLLFTMNVDW